MSWLMTILRNKVERKCQPTGAYHRESKIPKIKSRSRTPHASTSQTNPFQVSFRVSNIWNVPEHSRSQCSIGTWRGSVITVMWGTLHLTGISKLRLSYYVSTQVLSDILLYLRCACKDYRYMWNTCFVNYKCQVRVCNV